MGAACGKPAKPQAHPSGRNLNTCKIGSTHGGQQQDAELRKQAPVHTSSQSNTAGTAGNDAPTTDTTTEERLAVTTASGAGPESEHAAEDGPASRDGNAACESLGEHMKMNNSQRVIQSRGSTVSDVAAMLHDVCDKMQGRFSAAFSLHQHTIRQGIHAAVAEATSHGVTATVLFFPDGRRFNRQLRSYERRWLADFMPNKLAHAPGGPFTWDRTTVMLPPHIMVDRVSSVQEALDCTSTVDQACAEIFNVAIQLHHQIHAFHRRDKVLRDIDLCNVVSTIAGAQRRWTLLEYCAVAGNGAESNSVPVRKTPPELAEAAMEVASLRMDPAFDIWQLGVMIYEALAGPYWPPGTTDASVLHQLATPSIPLPHEARPPEPSNMAAMLRVLLARDPQERPSAESLRKVLEEYDNTGTVGSFTSPWLDLQFSNSAGPTG